MPSPRSVYETKGSRSFVCNASQNWTGNTAEGALTLRNFTIEEKLNEVLRLQRIDGDNDVLREIAKDLRARLSTAPSAVLCDLDRRIGSVARTRGPTGYQPHALHMLGECVAARWPVIRQALERFGAEVEA